MFQSTSQYLQSIIDMSYFIAGEEDQDFLKLSIEFDGPRKKISIFLQK